MKAAALILELEALDPDMDVSAWLKGRTMPSQIRVLTAEEAGVAVRALVDAIGKPFMNYNSIPNKGRMTHRNIIWNATVEKGCKAVEALEKAGITDYKITDMGWLHIHVPFDTQYRDLVAVEDPEVWKQKTEERKKKRQEQDAAIAKRLQEQREMLEASWNSPEAVKQREEQAKIWNEKQEAEKKEKEEQARLALVGAVVERNRKKIKVDDPVNNKGREIEL